MSPPPHQNPPPALESKASSLRNISLSPHRLAEPLSPCVSMEDNGRVNPFFPPVQEAPTVTEPRQLMLTSSSTSNTVLVQSAASASNGWMDGRVQELMSLPEGYVSYIARVAPAEENFAHANSSNAPKPPNVVVLDQTPPPVAPHVEAPFVASIEPESGPIHSPAVGEPDGLHNWLTQKLKQERREVLLHLEQSHLRLMEQFLMRTSRGSMRTKADQQEHVSETRAFAIDNGAYTFLGDDGEIITTNDTEGMVFDVAREETPAKIVSRTAPTKVALRNVTVMPSIEEGMAGTASEERLFARGAPNSQVPRVVLPPSDEGLFDSAEALDSSSQSAIVKSSDAAPKSKLRRSESRMIINEEQEKKLEHDIVESNERKSSYAKTSTIEDLSRIAVPFENTRCGHFFEVFFAFMIFANTLVMALNTQYRGLQIGYELSYRTYTKPMEEAWPGGKLAFNIMEKSFTILFTIEFLCRCAIFKFHFLKDCWCYFDFCIVALAWVMFFYDGDVAVNVTFVRLVRLSKLLRLVHLLRSQDIFGSLRMLVAAIMASVHTLFWSLFVLLLLQFLAGLGMVQALDGFLDDDTQDLEIRRRVFGHWGTFWRAMITIFEITFANWVPSCRLLVDHVSETYAAFYIVYRCMIGFAVLMVVKAVFLQQTMKTVKISDDQVAHEKEVAKAKMVRRLEKLFMHLDQSGDGFLEWDELQPVLQTGEMEAMLELFGLEVSDFDTLFKLLDDGDGRISIEEFVKGVSKIKGNAREIDLLEVKQIIRQLDESLGVRRSPRVSNKVKRGGPMSPRGELQAPLLNSEPIPAIQQDVGLQVEEEKDKPQTQPSSDTIDAGKRETSRGSLLEPQGDHWESTPRGQAFELFFVGIILLNTFVMALDAQYRGIDRGHKLGYRTYDLPAEESWPGGKVTFDVFEKTFTVIFTLEWFIRLSVHKLRYFRDRWCYFDAVIVILAWVIFFDKDILNINVTFARLARFSKLLRIIHLLRSQDVFDSLKLLVAAIRASVNTLFWSLVILTLIQSIAGLFMVQVLEPFLQDETKDILVQRRVFGYWGTFWRASLTMFEITFANWVPSCRLLVDSVSELYGSFYLVYRCVIGFAVLMVVQAVFIQQTMKTVQLGDAHVAAQKARAKKKLVGRLQNMFNRLDKSGDGILEWEELSESLGSVEMVAMLQVFELETSDCELLFKLLDNGDGKILGNEFVSGVQHLKGPARELDLLDVKRRLKALEANIKASQKPTFYPTAYPVSPSCHGSI